VAASGTRRDVDFEDPAQPGGPAPAAGGGLGRGRRREGVRVGTLGDRGVYGRRSGQGGGQQRGELGAVLGMRREQTVVAEGVLKRRGGMSNASRRISASGSGAEPEAERDAPQARPGGRRPGGRRNSRCVEPSYQGRLSW
jgi:hypothetical protein